MFKVINHPLIDIKLTTMRNKETSSVVFRNNLQQICSLMLYEVLKDYNGVRKIVESPTGIKAEGKDFDQDIIVVPILRAGLGMMQGIEEIIPQIRVGHIGLYRNEETFEPQEYFFKMPQASTDAQIIVVDPMLATGQTMISAVNKIKAKGFHNIKIMSLVASPEGVNNFLAKFPAITIYIASLDQKLDKNKYIIPGLGDAGDRIFDTN